MLSICVISMSRTHLVLSAPWLAGSGLTILLDFFVRDTTSIHSVPFHLPVAMQTHWLTYIGRLGVGTILLLSRPEGILASWRMIRDG